MASVNLTINVAINIDTIALIMMVRQYPDTLEKLSSLNTKHAAA